VSTSKPHALHVLDAESIWDYTLESKTIVFDSRKVLLSAKIAESSRRVRSAGRRIAADSLRMGRGAAGGFGEACP